MGVMGAVACRSAPGRQPSLFEAFEFARAVNSDSDSNSHANGLVELGGLEQTCTRKRTAPTTPSAEVQPQGEFGGKLPPVRTNQLNWGWPWPGRGLASCPQFGSFDGRSQGGFEKPALGCIFHRAGPGLPGDMRPGDDDKRNRPQGGFSKPALGCIFHKAGPGLPRGR